MGYRPVDPLDPEERARWPWEDPDSVRGAVFVALGATGADPSVDGLFRLAALRRGPGGEWERFERFCDPFPGEGEDSATRRMVQEFGVTGADLEGAPPAEELAAEFVAWLGAGPILTADGDSTHNWLAHLTPGMQLPRVLGIDEGAALLLPGREARHLPAGAGPREVQAALAHVVGEFLELPEGVREFGLCALAASWTRLDGEEPALAGELADWLALVEHPLQWAADPEQLFAAHSGLGDGRAAQALAAAGRGDPAEHARELIEVLEPRCAAVGRLWQGFDTLAVHARGELALEEHDLRRIDEVFEVHLPALAAGPDGELDYRAGQHQVAREVARTLGARELLLVSAPTGTGKTLAYLVPAALWAWRNQVRVGISTYTRTLQEQAASREVPRALAALARSGLDDRPRVSLLKGRANYLCWRTLRAQAPGEDDGPAQWLAWTLVALFALCDDDGDLDRLALRFPLGGRAQSGKARSGTAARAQRELEQAVRGVRAQSSCCTRSDDRQTCAAEVARSRAERSHLVITNHAFALARQAFFKHLIFDECEHLHEQAHSAWSHTLTTRELGDLLARLRQPGRAGSRATLDRLARTLPGGDARLEPCELAWRATRSSLDALERALKGFGAWREEVRRTRDERDEHALLREFLEHADEIELAPPLIAARVDLARALTELDAGLSDLAAALELTPGRGLPRLRRALELTRSDLLAALAALQAWLPMVDDQPALRAETFHDVEVDARGNETLAARVLLPNEFLGRYYYPQLESAVLLSATTWLQGGFESSMGYLGLDRAAHPAPDEEREPCSVRSFRAPEVFDYGRVLVGVPRDAPEPRQKEAWLAFVRRFIAHLGERTRGRMLVLFTNAEEARRVGEGLAGHFRARHIPLWWQNMPGVAKEELPRLFRSRKDSILFGLDTFWFGADFPGETLEYLVIARLPYGVPDRYHHAQCAALGAGDQRRRIYMPRALAKLRQGFGRLMRRVEDKGCVYLLDRRVIDPRHRAFLREMPLAGGFEGGAGEQRGRGAKLVTAPSDEVVRAGLAHMGMLADVRRRGLEEPFDTSASAVREAPVVYELPRPTRIVDPAPRTRIEFEMLDIPPEDVPF